ncbi:hypothetical protein ACH3XW_10630 [Acanthocheilonema viteae]
MSHAVVFIVCLAVTLSTVHCLKRETCKRNYYMKKIGAYNYCYRMHVIDKSDTIATADESHCRRTSRFPTISSISLRNKEEYEFVKVFHRSFRRLLPPMPLMIGLTYKNDSFHWFDKSPFNYTEFLNDGYESYYSQYKKTDCRRLFLHSRIIHGYRKYYTFDVDCNAQFRQYFVLCRYQLLLPTIRTRQTTATTTKSFHKTSVTSSISKLSYSNLLLLKMRSWVIEKFSNGS